MYQVDTRELQKAMIDAGIRTIEQLSEVTGVNRNTLANVVNGRAFPSSMVMTKIMHHLNLSSEQAGRIFFAQKLA